MVHLLRALAWVVLCALAYSPAYSATVWFADKQAVRQINADTNAVNLSVTLDQTAALAANPQDGSVWALSASVLNQYGGDGALIRQILLKDIANDFGNSRHAGVDPSDGSVWIAGDKRLIHLSASGGVLANVTTPDVIQDMTVAQDKTVWILGQTTLLQYASSGGPLATVNLTSQQQQSKYIALDDNAGLMWLAGSKTAYQRSLIQPGNVLLTIALSDTVSGLSVSPNDHTAWISSQTTLSAYGVNGARLHYTDFKSVALTNPISLAFDPASNNLWLAHQSGISRFNLQGRYVVTIPASVQVTAIGRSSFVIPIPTISLIRPPTNGISNQAAPTIQFSYSALCAGQSCGYPNSYYAGYTLSALINGQQLGPQFVYDQGTGLASYTPSSRLPEGGNSISAKVTDQNGRVSDSVNATFTIDTIPPKFVSVSPPSNSGFVQPQITIAGSIDDPTANVSLNNGGTSLGQNFSFPVTLTLGQNNFVLSAIDPAGNVTSQPLVYFYSPFSITLDSPAANAVIDAAQVSVTGTYANANSATVTVNGVSAQVAGNAYSAKIPLTYGANTITVNAVADSGASATKSITVTSTVPSVTITQPANGATVSDSSVLVSGVVKGPSNIGVVVNGVVAIVDGNNNFYANDVPLQIGSNTVTATVTNQAGKSSSSSVAITNVGQAPISITASSVQGLTPFTASFSAQSDIGASIVSWQADPGGPGNFDTSDPTVLFKFTYSQAGIYQMRVTATDNANNSYSKTFVISALDANQMDAKFKAIWDGMNNALIAGDQATALTYLSLQAQEKYASVFTALAPQMANIVATFSPLQRAAIAEHFSEYAVNRTIDGVNRIFFIYFVQSREDGMWRLDAM